MCFYSTRIMMFNVIVTCLVCCGMWQSVVAEAAVCMSESYFEGNCTETLKGIPTVTTTETLTTTNTSDNTSVSQPTTMIRRTTSPITDSTTISANSTSPINDSTTVDDTTPMSSMCCYEPGQMCDDNFFNSSDCLICSKKCYQGCYQNKTDKCRCLEPDKKTNSDLCNGYPYDDNCKCQNKCNAFQFDCYLENEVEYFVAFIVGVVVGVILITIGVVCLVCRLCFHGDGPPTLALSWKAVNKPVPVQKPIEMEAATTGQTDYDDVYGNINAGGGVDVENAPENTAVTIQLAGNSDGDFGGLYGNVPDAPSERITERLLPQIPDGDDYGNEYGNVDYPGPNKGRSNASFEKDASSLPRVPSNPPSLNRNINQPPLPSGSRPSSTSSKSKILPKQTSLPDANPPPPPTFLLGKMLMEGLTALPAPRHIDTDEDVFGSVIIKPLPSPNDTNDHGGTYEMPISQNDFGGNYEVPAPAGSQDYDGTYEIAINKNFSPTAAPGNDKKKLGPPIQNKKPKVGKKPSAKPAKKPENNPQDYGDMYEAPISQGFAGQPDYDEDYEAPMIQNLAKEPDFGGDYEAPMIQNLAKEQDFGGDYEAPMIQNIAKEQDFGGDYEALMTQDIARDQDFGGDYEAPMIQNIAGDQDFGGDYEAPMLHQTASEDADIPNDPDFDCIYENTMITPLQKPPTREVADPPAEDYNNVYDQPYELNQPLKFKGQRGDYYNQPGCPKGNPGTNKENYTKLYRS